MRFSTEAQEWLILYALWTLFLGLQKTLYTSFFYQKNASEKDYGTTRSENPKVPSQKTAANWAVG